MVSGGVAFGEESATVVSGQKLGGGKPAACSRRWVSGSLVFVRPTSDGHQSTEARLPILRFAENSCSEESLCLYRDPRSKTP